MGRKGNARVTPPSVSGTNGPDPQSVAAMRLPGITPLFPDNYGDFQRFPNLTALSPSDI